MPKPLGQRHHIDYICDPDGTRTHDSHIKSVILYQLSYEVYFNIEKLKKLSNITIPSLVPLPRLELGSLLLSITF